MKNAFLNRLFQLEDKTVMVTGATGQLGHTICKAYADVGARVIGLDKELNPQRVLKADRIEYRPMDIADKQSVRDTLEDIYGRYERIDILVNNAGVSVFEPFEERSEESFDWVTDVNLKGTFFCIQNYVRHQRAKGHPGNIVNIASIYGVVSPDLRIYTDCERRNSEVYGAVKAGILQMTRYFAAALAKDNIRVNAISPGGIFNPDAPQGEDFVKNYSQRVPLGRMAYTEDMIGGLLYLSSDAAKYTTGQNIVIDGGMSCW